MTALVQIDDWRLYKRDGEQFLQTARNAHRQRKKAFSPETLYNLTCMGIEKLIMAFLMQRGDLPENHTMGDLLRAVESHLGENSRFAAKMRYLDSFQEICDLDAYEIRVPSGEDVGSVLAIGLEVQKMLAPYMTN